MDNQLGNVARGRRRGCCCEACHVFSVVFSNAYRCVVEFYSPPQSPPFSSFLKFLFPSFPNFSKYILLECDFVKLNWIMRPKIVGDSFYRLRLLGV